MFIISISFLANEPKLFEIQAFDGDKLIKPAVYVQKLWSVSGGLWQSKR